jgi:uncharacterized membrane protein YoaK (UPF0700 family)
MSVLREAASTLRPPVGDRHGPLAPMLVALTCLTGVVDAVSYLMLGHVFVANMTGNVVFIGFALAGASGLSAPASLAALASFLLGAALGGRIGALIPAHRGRLLRGAGATPSVALIFALIVSLAVSGPLTGSVRYALLIPLALGMGIQNATAQRLAVPELTTTVLTRTLTGLASEGTALGGKGAQPGRRVVAVAAMLLGAVAGGVLALEVSVAAALGLACAIVVSVTLALHALSRGEAVWTRA